MKIRKVDALYQISYMENIFPVNIYIVEEEDYLTVIDMGVSQFPKYVKKISDDINKPVKNLVLTHAHSDHVMGMDNFKQLFPNAKIYLSAREHRFVEEGLKFDAAEQGYKVKGDYSKWKYPVDGELNEGDNIGSLRVVTTPGHTVGSISFWHEPSKTIIVGDAMQTKGKVAVSGYLVKRFPFPAFATGNKMVSLESVKKIYALSPERLAVGHGKMIDQPMKKIGQAITHFEKRLS